MLSTPPLDDKARRKAASEKNAKTDERFYAKLREENGGELPADMVGPDGQPRKLTNGPEDEKRRKQWFAAQAEVEQEDAAAASVGTGDVGGVCQPCMEKTKAETKKEGPDCSVAKVLLSRAGRAGEVEYVKMDGKWVVREPKKDTPEAYKLTLEDARKGTVLEMVAGNASPDWISHSQGGGKEGARKRVHVQVEMAAGPCDGSRHPVVDFDGQAKRCGSAAKDAFFDVYCDDPGSSDEWDWTRWFFPSLSPRVYSVLVAACGVLKTSKNGADTGGLLQVRAYPCHQYAVRLVAPSFADGSRSRSWALKLETADDQRFDSRGREYGDARARFVFSDERANRKGDVETRNESIRGLDGSRTERSVGRIGDSESRLFQGESGKSRWMVTDQVYQDGDFQFEYSRNGVQESVAFDVAKIVQWVKQCKSKIDQIKGLLTTVAIGPRFDFDYKILEGSAMLSYGWKEHTDHRAYFAYDLSVDLLLVSINLEGSFGLQVSSLVTAKCYLKVSGEARFKRSLLRDDPDKNLDFVDSLPINIVGEGGGVASAGLMSIEWRREYRLKTGFSGEASIRLGADGLNAKIAVRFLGVKRYIVRQDVFDASEQETYTFFEESPENEPLVGFEWPKSG